MSRSSQGGDNVAVLEPSRRPPFATAMVLYRHNVGGVQEHPAIVTFVRGDNDLTVDLYVMFNRSGAANRVDVKYDDSMTPKFNTWRWPPRS
jgi:hypothetical protein